MKLFNVETLNTEQKEKICSFIEQYLENKLPKKDKENFEKIIKYYYREDVDILSVLLSYLGIFKINIRIETLKGNIKLLMSKKNGK